MADPNDKFAPELDVDAAPQGADSSAQEISPGKPKCCPMGSSLTGALFALLIVAAVQVPANWSYWKNAVASGDFGLASMSGGGCSKKSSGYVCSESAMTAGSSCCSSESSASMAGSEGCCESSASMASLPSNPADMLAQSEDKAEASAEKTENGATSTESLSTDQPATNASETASATPSVENPAPTAESATAANPQ